MEKKALGKGLSALIPQKEVSIENSAGQEKVLDLAISKIKTNKYQPRFDFNEEKLSDLVNSIKEKGIVQPVLVRAAQEGYELIAGERRLRAAKKVGLESIPAIIKNVDDLNMLEISLIENIQREGLNPIEEARAFQKFITDFQFTQEKISQVIGKDRSTIANTIRLLSLPKKVQDYISQGAITAGHAKALLALPTETGQLKVCEVVIKGSLSVRETEDLVAKRTSGLKRIAPKQDPDVAELESQLQRSLGTRVRILHGKKRGRIQIDYYSNEDLNRLLDILLSKASSTPANAQ